MCEFCSNPKLISKLPDQIQTLKIIVVFKPPGVSLGSVDSHQCLLAGKVSAKLESVMREGGGNISGHHQEIKFQNLVLLEHLFKSFMQSLITSEQMV